MNELKVFSSSEFGELGIMIIDGREYFPAKHCASILGYKDTTNAIKQHCKGVVKHHLPTNGGMQMVNYIPEGDLYRLIVGSKLPAAEKFERWVFDEVLPSIRRNGGYITNAEELIAKTATAVAGEVMKQLLPLLNQTSRSSKPRFKRYRYETPSIISQLKPELKNQVEWMLRSGEYSCQSIANFLRDNGVQISQMSVNNYGHRHIWNKEENDHDNG